MFLISYCLSFFRLSTSIFGIDDVLLGGIISGLGSVGGGLLNSGAQADANKSNLEAVRETNLLTERNVNRQMEFQERMSNSAYQRSMDDMKRAGLNPMLGFSQGGASAPSGSVGSYQAGRVESTHPGEILKSAGNSAVDTMILDRNLRQKDADITLTAAQAVEAAARADSEQTNASVRKSEAPSKKAQAAISAKPGVVIVDAIIDRAKNLLGIGSSALGLATGTGQLMKSIKKGNDRFIKSKDGKAWQDQMTGREYHQDPRR